MVGPTNLLTQPWERWALWPATMPTLLTEHLPDRYVLWNIANHNTTYIYLTSGYSCYSIDIVIIQIIILRLGPSFLAGLSLSTV